MPVPLSVAVTGRPRAADERHLPVGVVDHALGDGLRRADDAGRVPVRVLLGVHPLVQRTGGRAVVLAAVEAIVAVAQDQGVDISQSPHILVVHPANVAFEHAARGVVEQVGRAAAR